MLLRQEAGLDRSIDRKVRILLTMRKEHAQEAHTSRQKQSGRMRHPSQPEASPPDNESNDREAQELSKLVGVDSGEVAPTFRSAHAGLKASATAALSESPKEEKVVEIPNSPEQSENVLENKGPAAKDVRG